MMALCSEPIHTKSAGLLRDQVSSSSSKKTDHSLKIKQDGKQLTQTNTAKHLNVPLGNNLL